MFNLAEKKSLQYRRYLTVLLLTYLLSACGFQLRGSLDMSDAISPLYLQENNAFALSRELKQLLSTNNISITKRVARSSSQLMILGEDQERRVLTVDGDGRAREYLLTYKVRFVINMRQAENKEVTDSISLSRSLLFNTEAVLAVTNESEILYRDMQRNAARLILLKLEAFARTDSTSNNSTTSAEAKEKVQ